MRQAGVARAVFSDDGSGGRLCRRGRRRCCCGGVSGGRCRGGCRGRCRGICRGCRLRGGCRSGRSRGSRRGCSRRVGRGRCSRRFSRGGCFGGGGCRRGGLGRCRRRGGGRGRGRRRRRGRRSGGRRRAGLGCGRLGSRRRLLRLQRLRKHQTGKCQGESERRALRRQESHGGPQSCIRVRTACGWCKARKARCFGMPRFFSLSNTNVKLSTIHRRPFAVGPARGICARTTQEGRDQARVAMTLAAASMAPEPWGMANACRPASITASAPST